MTSGERDSAVAAEELRVLAGALRLGGRFVVADGAQLAGQLLARVEAVDGGPAGLARLRAAASTPDATTWLQPLTSSLATSGARLILSGHTNSVQALATSPDGRLLVSGSWDRTIRVWDLANGRALHVLEGHDEYLESVLVMTDSRRAVSGSVDGTARVWDLEVGSQIRTYDAGAPVIGVALHPDGERVAVATPFSVVLWDVDSGAVQTVVADTRPADARGDGDPAAGSLLRQIMAMSGRGAATFVSGDPIVTLAVAPDGGRLFTGRVTGAVEWWDLTGEGGPTGRYGADAHRGPVWALAPAPDGTALVSAGEDGLAHIWDVASGARRSTLEGHRDSIRAATVTPDGAHVITGSKDMTVRVWDATTGAQVAVLEGHGNGVYSVAALPDGSQLASGGDDRTIRLWPHDATTAPRRDDTSEPLVLRGHDEGIMSVAVVPGTDLVVSASQDHTLKVWDAGTGDAVRTLEGHTAEVLGVAVTPDGRRIVSGGDTTVRVWDAATGEALAKWDAHFLGTSCVAVSGSGDRVLSGGVEGGMKLWDLDTGTLLHELRVDAPIGSVALAADGEHALAGTADGDVLLVDLAHETTTPAGPRRGDFVRAVLFGHDERWVVAGAMDGATTVWDPSSGEMVWRLDAGRGPVGAVIELSDDALATSYVDGSVVLWDLASGAATATIPVHDGPIGALADLGADRIVTGSGDKTLRVLELAGREEASAPAHSSAVTGLAMDDGGTALFSVSKDRTVRMWDPGTGGHVAVMGGSAGPVSCLALAPDGRTLVSITDDGSLSRWDVEHRRLGHYWDLDKGAIALAITPDRNRAVLSSVDGIRIVSLQDGTVTKEFALAGDPSSIAMDLAVLDDRTALALDEEGVVRVIDLMDGTERRRLDSPPGNEGLLFEGAIAVDRALTRVAGVAVQHNDRGIHDNPIRVWDLQRGALRCELRGHTDWVLDLAFAGPGRLVSSSQDGTVRVWDVDRGETIAGFGTDERLATVATDASGTLVAAAGSSGTLHFLRLQLAATA